MDDPNIRYAVYFNLGRLPTLHKFPASHKLKLHGGIDIRDHGGWAYFSTKNEAIVLIKNINDYKKDADIYCSRCYGKSKKQKKLS